MLCQVQALVPALVPMLALAWALVLVPALALALARELGLAWALVSDMVEIHMSEFHCWHQHMRCRHMLVLENYTDFCFADHRRMTLSIAANHSSCSIGNSQGILACHKLETQWESIHNPSRHNWEKQQQT